MAQITVKKKIRFSVIVLSVLSFISCNTASRKDDAELYSQDMLNDESATMVSTTTVQKKKLEYFVNANGKIKSLTERVIFSERGGKLLVCKVKTGAFFNKGSLLAQFESMSVQHRLERAQLAKFNNEREYESQLLGYENLLKDKTEEQVNVIKQKLKISSGLAGSEQEIKEANYELKQATILAPFSGVIADVKIQEGQQLKGYDELFKIYNPNNLVLEIKVLEADLILLKTGMNADISTISNEATIYKATVYEINPTVDENGMVLIRLKILNYKPLSSNRNVSSAHVANQSLFPGMSCFATIFIPLEITLVVPKEAVVMRNNKQVVFTFEEGKAKWNYVTIGLDNGKEVQILKGLMSGQKIIISNNLQLGHDAPVKEESYPQ